MVCPSVRIEVVRVIDLVAEGPLIYHDVDARQRALHEQVATGSHEGAVILTEMRSVYTAGRRTAPWDRINPDLDVVDVDRGGRITWHGPGQIVAYPVIRLVTPLDVVAYVRALEGAVIATLAEFDITAGRVAGRSGVWLFEPDRKICAIGVRVARGATLHGIALNVTNSLDPYGEIVPCGISDAGVTTMAREGADVSLSDVAPRLATHLMNSLMPLTAETHQKEVG